MPLSESVDGAAMLESTVGSVHPDLDALGVIDVTELLDHVLRFEESAPLGAFGSSVSAGPFLPRSEFDSGALGDLLGSEDAASLLDYPRVEQRGSPSLASVIAPLGVDCLGCSGGHLFLLASDDCCA